MHKWHICLCIEQYNSIEVEFYAQIIIFYTKIKPAKRGTPSSTLDAWGAQMSTLFREWWKIIYLLVENLISCNSVLCNLQQGN